MADIKQLGQTVANGLIISNQNRHIVSEWAQSVANDQQWHRDSEHIRLVKEEVARMERILDALKDLMSYEENR